MYYLPWTKASTLLIPYYSCNESMCNSDDYVYHGYKMADWMLKLEERIEIATLAENEAKKSSSPSLAVLLPLLILSFLL